MSNEDKDGRVFSRGKFSGLLEQIQTFVLQLKAVAHALPFYQDH